MRETSIRLVKGKPTPSCAPRVWLLGLQAKSFLSLKVGISQNRVSPLEQWVKALVIQIQGAQSQGTIVWEAVKELK